MGRCEGYYSNPWVERSLLWRRDYECEGFYWLWILVCTSRFSPDLPPYVTINFSSSTSVINFFWEDFFYCHSFWSYEYCKRWMISENEDTHQVAMKVLLCGGIAGVATWASIFPLDVIKTRLQAQSKGACTEGRPLLPSQTSRQELSTCQLTKEVYRNEGMKVFYRGLGVCSSRAFIVNAVQVRSPRYAGQ